MAVEDASPEVAPPASPEPAVVEVVEAAPVETVEAAPEPEPSAIEGAAEAEAVPAEEAAPAEPVVEAAAEPAAEPAEVAPEATPEVVPPTYEAFTLPEGFSAEPDQIEAFTGVIGQYGVPQEAAQALMDMHSAALQKVADQLTQNQQDVFSQTRRTWVQDFDKIAGNRRDTVLNDAKWAVTQLVPDDKARTELWNVLAFTGAGDHPAVVFAFANAAKRLREAPSPPPPTPPKGQAMTAAERRYGAAKT